MKYKLIHDAVISNYRRLRQMKNRMLNLIDQPVVVLIYHRVNVLPADRRQLAVTPDNFRAHLQYLKQNFRIVRFEEDWSDLKEPVVAITFDDGYADNVIKALPILEDVGVPATFFISTGAIGTHNEFCWDELERIILEDADYPSHFNLIDPDHGRRWHTVTLEQRLTMYNELLPVVQMLPFERREAWLDQLRSWAGTDKKGREINRPLSHEELKLLGRSPWATVGAHTVTHTPLASLTDEEQKYEIITSRNYLEEFLQQKITIFSYPFGRKDDYTATSIKICKGEGFKRVAANFPGQAHRWTDPFQIPRQLVRNWDKAAFAANMESFWF
jgi:peptidoglycan/xylan/chitin deacetylase (PgdA/CDA1 family)